MSGGKIEPDIDLVRVYSFFNMNYVLIRQICFKNSKNKQICFKILTNSCCKLQYNQYACFVTEKEEI